MLGDIVNVVSNYAVSDSLQDAKSSFVSEIRDPAVRLVKIYLAQGLFTFGYIYSLSCVGT